jgi:hypothetical protein
MSNIGEKYLRESFYSAVWKKLEMATELFRLVYLDSPTVYIVLKRCLYLIIDAEYISKDSIEDRLVLIILIELILNKWDDDFRRYLFDQVTFIDLRSAFLDHSITIFAIFGTNDGVLIDRTVI